MTELTSDRAVDAQIENDISFWKEQKHNPQAFCAVCDETTPHKRYFVKENLNYLECLFCGTSQVEVQSV